MVIFLRDLERTQNLSSSVPHALDAVVFLARVRYVVSISYLQPSIALLIPIP